MTFSFKFVSRKQDGSLLPGRGIARSVSAAVGQVCHVPPHVSAQHYQPTCKRLFTPAIFSVCVNFVWSESSVQIVAVHPVKVYVAWRIFPLILSSALQALEAPADLPLSRTQGHILVKKKTSCPSQEMNRDFSDQFKAYRLNAWALAVPFSAKGASRSICSKESNVSCPIAFLLLLAPTHLPRYRVPGPFAKGKCVRSLKPL